MEPRRAAGWSDGDVVVAEMIGDLAGGLSGELFDVRGGEADVEVGATEERCGEGDRGRETFGDGAGVVATRDPVAAEERGDLWVGVEGGEPWIDDVRGWPACGWSAAADGDSVVVQGAEYLVDGGVLVGGDLG